MLLHIGDSLATGYGLHELRCHQREVRLPRQDRPWRRRSLERQGRGRCGRADGPRLRQAARAPASDLSRPPRHHRGRHPAEHHRRLRADLVVRARRQHGCRQGDLRQARQDRRRRGADDRHHGTTRSTPRHGRSSASSRSPRRCRPTSRRSACRNGARTSRPSRANSRPHGGAADRLATEPTPLGQRPQSASSNDNGDVTWVVPSAALNFPGSVPGHRLSQLAGRRDADQHHRAQGHGRRRRRCWPGRSSIS